MVVLSMGLLLRFTATHLTRTLLEEIVSLRRCVFWTTTMNEHVYISHTAQAPYILLLVCPVWLYSVCTLERVIASFYVSPTNSHSRSIA